MAEALDNTRGPGVWIRHIPIHNEGDGGLFAPLGVHSVQPGTVSRIRSLFLLALRVAQQRYAMLASCAMPYVGIVFILVGTVVITEATYEDMLSSMSVSRV